MAISYSYPAERQIFEIVQPYLPNNLENALRLNENGDLVNPVIFVKF